MTNIYLVTYKPLAGSKSGREAAKEYGLPPFIDSSCRREPDFESVYPSISALCRAGKFAPRLGEGDVVIYITCLGRYPNIWVNDPHWRITAILEVYKRFETHKKAEEWYQSQSLLLPSNCMVPGNSPIPLEKTARFSGKPTILTVPTRYTKKQLPVLNPILLEWNSKYQQRAETWKVFLACTSTPLHIELYSPPIITRQHMIDIFGKIPCMRSFYKVSINEYSKIKRMCGL